MNLKPRRSGVVPRDDEFVDRPYNARGPSVIRGSYGSNLNHIDRDTFDNGPRSQIYNAARNRSSSLDSRVRGAGPP